VDYLWSDEQVSRIIDQALIYQCACPAQVGKKIIALRRLYAYQNDCLNQTDTDCKVHECIAQATAKAHALMELCLRNVLELEGWDMQSLQMPEKIRCKVLKF